MRPLTPTPHARVGLQHLHRAQHLLVEVQIGIVQQLLAVMLHRTVGRRPPQRRQVDDIALANSGQRFQIVAERIALVRQIPVQVLEPGEARAFFIMPDVQGLSDLIQGFELQELRTLGGQQVQAETVDGPNEHIGHAGNRLDRLLRYPVDDASPQLGGGLVGEGESDDVGRGQRVVPSGDHMSDPVG